MGVLLLSLPLCMATIFRGPWAQQSTPLHRLRPTSHIRTWWVPGCRCHRPPSSSGSSGANTPLCGQCHLSPEFACAIRDTRAGPFLCPASGVGTDITGASALHPANAQPAGAPACACTGAGPRGTRVASAVSIRNGSYTGASSECTHGSSTGATSECNYGAATCSTRARVIFPCVSVSDVGPVVHRRQW